MNNKYTAQQAQQRVQNSNALRPYNDIICEYDWPNMDEHIEWVCTAPISEILKWAQSIREDETA